MHLIRERAGVISERPIWVLFDAGYMYEAETLLELFHILDTEWQHDRHLIG